MARPDKGLRGRIDLRISNADDEDDIRSAARAANEPVTKFILAAALERAHEILSARIEVPSDYFDELVMSLEDAPEPRGRLGDYAARPRQFRWRT